MLEAQYLGWLCVCVMGRVRSGQTACQQPFIQLKACNIQPVHTTATPTKTIKPCCSPSCLQLSSFCAVKLKGSDETERPSNTTLCRGVGIKFRTIVEQQRRQDGAPRTNDGLNRVSLSSFPLKQQRFFTIFQACNLTNGTERRKKRRRGKLKSLRLATACLYLS